MQPEILVLQVFQKLGRFINDVGAIMACSVSKCVIGIDDLVKIIFIIEVLGYIYYV